MILQVRRVLDGRLEGDDGLEGGAGLQSDKRGAQMLLSSRVRRVVIAI